jgi:hypothetical protein
MDSDPPQPRRTRSKNTTQHPGLAIPRKPRRSKAQIAEDKKAKEAERAAKQQKKDDDIQALAALEDKMAIEDSKAENSHPRRSDGHLLPSHLKQH